MKEQYYEQVNEVLVYVNQIVVGKEQVVKKVMAAILAGGHILLEDIPGVGKTTMAVAFSNALSLCSKRLQFTPDVMPSDVLGFSLYNKKTGEFEYQPGAVACNLFLGDEINRTSPKTQSALLEVMEEGNVTVDGVTRKVPDPFIVIATENPAGSVGTQMLPESQLDRFMICTSMGYPELEDEIAIVKGKQEDRLHMTEVHPMSREQLLACREAVAEIYVSDEVYRYICELCQKTRNHPMVELGVSPRGSVALASVARAIAFLNGRDYVLPEDVQEVFYDVAAHRLLLSSKARASKTKAEDVLNEIVHDVKGPRVNGRAK